MQFKRLLLACIAISFGLSFCQTTSNEANFVDGENVPLRINPEEENAEETIPAFLWSPSRRRATAGYYFLVAEYMALERQYQEALPLFETAYNLDPNPFLGGKLIATEASVGHLQKALPEARKMVLLYPKSARLHFLYGQLLAKHGFYGDSEKELEKAIDLEPQNEEFYLELADLHQRTKDLPKAIVIVSELVEKIPNSVQGWVKLAKLHLAASQKKRALKPAQRAYEMQSSNPENVLIYALALELNDQSKKAIALYEQLYRLNPTNEELISRMVELYRSVGDLNESLDLLNELAALPGGNRPGVQLQRAIILWELERFEEASKTLDQLSKDYPEHDRLRYMSGLGQEKLQEYKRALETFSDIKSSSQFYIHSQFRMAIILKQLKRFDEAIVIINNLENADGTGADVFVLGSSIFSDMKQYREAVNLLGRGFTKYPNKIKLLFLKGVYLEKAGEIDECVATMKEVIELDPNNSGAFNYLGYLYAERGIKLDEAESLIKRALEIKPNDGYYIDSLAWVYYQQGRYKKALPLLNKALELVPDEGVILEHLGDVYEKLGDKLAALEHYRRAVNGRLEDGDKQRIQKKLNSLEKRVSKKQQ